MEKVLVAGATGTTGRMVVKLLNESQYFEPVAMVRKREQQNNFNKEGIKAIVGDLENSLENVAENIDKIVFAAGSKGKKVKEVDQEGAKKLVDEAKLVKVKKFIMLSSMGADNPENYELEEYLQAKHNADEYLKDSGLNYVIVRPGSLTNNEATGKIQLGVSLQGQGKISRSDVAQTLVRTLHDDAVNRQTFEILEGEILIGKALNEIEEDQNR